MQNAMSALNKNADAYLLKPIDVEKLLNLVKDQLQLQESEREYSEKKVVGSLKSKSKNWSSMAPKQTPQLGFYSCF